MKFQKSTLEENPHLLQPVLKLIEESLHYSENNQYQIDFSPLFDSQNFSNIHLLIYKSNPIATIGVFPANIEHENTKHPITCIGAVVIDPAFRGKGLFKSFFQEILDLYIKKTTFFLLWSDLFDLYKKFDFYPALTQFDCYMSLKNQNEFLESINFKILNNPSNKESSEIIKIYLQTTCEWYRFERDSKKWNQIFQHKSSQIRVRRNSEGEIKDYIILNKGEDLVGVIHEIGSLNDPYLLAKELSNCRVMIPFNPHIPKYYVRGNSSLLKIGNIELFNHFLATYHNEKIILSEQKDHTINFRFSQKTYNMESLQFIQGVLGPNFFNELIIKGEPRPIFIGGIDSI